MHQNRVERAVGNFLDADQFLPRVQEQNLQRLDVFQKDFVHAAAARHFRDYPARAIPLPFALHLPRQRERRHQRRRLVAPDAANLLQIGHGSLRQQFQRSKFLQNLFADLDGVRALQTRPQQNRDQFRVPQGVRPERREPFARTLAHRLVFKSHLRFGIQDLRLPLNFKTQRKSPANRKS